jgi:PKD repeat protein
MKKPKMMAFLGIILITGWLAQFVHNQSNLTYEWDFGNGSPKDSRQSPTHTYTAAGSWNWSMKVTQNGEACTKSGTITVKLKPTWTFMLYLAGDNNLSDLFTKTILSLEKLPVNTNVNLLVLYDGPQANVALGFGYNRVGNTPPE